MFKITLEKRLKYLIGFRLFFSIALIFLTALARGGLSEKLNLTEAIFIPTYSILIILLASNIIYLVLLKTNIPRKVHANIQIISDVIFVSLLILFSGIDKIYIGLYFIPLTFTPLVLDRWNSLFITTSIIIAISLVHVTHFLIYTDVINVSIFGIKASDLAVAKLVANYVSMIIAIVIVAVLSNLLAKELAVERQLRNLIFESVVDAVAIFSDSNKLILANKRFDEINLTNDKIKEILKSDKLTDEIPHGELTYQYRKLIFSNIAAKPITAIVVNDISSLKELERNKQKQEFYKSIVRISGALAHEIRNPLTSIKGASQELQKLSSNLEDSKLLQLIIKESDKLNSILNDFLKFASERPLNLRVCDLQEIVDNTINLIKLRFKDVSITKTGEYSRLFTKVDPDKISETILNLLINAAESKSEGVTIAVNIRKDDKYSIISIHDNGSGIRDEVRSKLFTPFITTKKNGTGLGLAIVKKIIDDHNGVITFNSSEGKGSTFFIYLPNC